MQKICNNYSLSSSQLGTPLPGTSADANIVRANWTKRRPTTAFHKNAGMTQYCAISIIVTLMLSYSIFDATVAATTAVAGCRQSDHPDRPLCCVGRNTSCRSREYPVRWPALRLMSIGVGEAFPPVLDRNDRRIGRLILPDMVALDSSTTKDQSLLLRQLGPAAQVPLRVFEDDPWEEMPLENDADRNGTESVVPRKGRAVVGDWIIFGTEFEELEVRDRIVRENGMPIIRYSLLNKHLPVRIGPMPSLQVPKGRQSDGEFSAHRIMYLTEAQPDCFCDELCVKFGDCCSDYTRVCPPIDCQLSPWSTWSPCVPEDGNNSCGIGFRQRHRQVLRLPQNAGESCSHLEESRGCFRECPSDPESLRAAHARGLTDITTVALLLDYRYNESRQIHPPKYANLCNSTDSERREKKFNRKKKRRRELSSVNPWHQTAPNSERRHIYYCVQYQIEWLNRNCIEQQWNTQLRQHSTICGECQPEAQFHRPTPRCASDLEDGQTGFWKLIGPPSCNGIWRRVSTRHNCRCAQQFPWLHPFLMV